MSGHSHGDEVLPVVRAIMTGRAVLVTGAGFSAGVLDATGHLLPLGGQMAREIWPIAFGAESFDDESSLGEIFARALQVNPHRLREYLDLAMTVSRDSIPDRYRDWFQLPWYRIYSLNIDDLPEALQASSPPVQTYEIVSALKSMPGDLQRASGPACIHLHGVVCDFPSVTFTPAEYARRTSRADPWYQQFAADILTRPTVFVGTQLDELAMWHYIQARSGRVSGLDPRPRSFLVTTSISRSREALLDDELNIELIGASEEEFFDEVLSPRLQQLIELTPTATSINASSVAMDVSTAITSPSSGSADFLFGLEPTWWDILDGFAVERSIDRRLVDSLTSAEPGVVVVHGTAGSGVSTSLRRVALVLSAAGRTVLWFNRDNSLTLREIRDRLHDRRPDFVFVDGVDRFGGSAEALLRGIASDNDCICVAGVRTSRFLDLFKRTERLQVVPEGDLSQEDAEALVASLTRANRLGKLRELATERERVDDILARHGGQLLVTMIEATSGVRLETKVAEELEALTGESRLVYSILCLSGHVDERLTDADVVLAVGSNGVATVTAIRNLLRANLVIRPDAESLSVRHRVIADVAVRAMRESNQLVESTKALLWLASVEAPTEMLPRDRYGRLLIRLLNHDFLYSLLQSANRVRDAYTSIEVVRSHDFHFWLQRAEFEIAHGDPKFATNFLAQAKVIRPDDILVRTADAHMMLKRACENPLGGGAAGDAQAGLNELAELLRSEPKFSPHTFGVYVKYGLEWAKHGGLESSERRTLMRSVVEALRKGRLIHRGNRMLDDLEPEVERIANQLGVS